MNLAAAAVARPTVSAIVVCFNEEQHIAACLESLCWCDEIVVVDSFSTDRTVEICRRFTEKTIQRPWTGYGIQKMSQATKEWVLSVDADERVTPELKKEIDEALRRDGGAYAGYAVPRLVFFLNRWWRRGGWYPDYNTRLFRRDRATWGGSEPHAAVLVSGQIRRLRHPLHHFTYRNIEDHMQRINRFTSISSRELRKSGQRWRLADALFRPAGRFFRCYFLRRGFMDGFAGFYVAITATMYVFLKYAKLWELELKEKDAKLWELQLKEKNAKLQELELEEKNAKLWELEFEEKNAIDRKR
jgi:glycosyltransferase involved in cell wall biosynthesis